MSKIKVMSYIVLGEGEKCVRCGEIMERRKHRFHPKKNWFFTEWDYCKNINCKMSVQHYEKYKSQDWQEIENQENHMRDIKNATLF